MYASIFSNSLENILLSGVVWQNFRVSLSKTLTIHIDQWLVFGFLEESACIVCTHCVHPRANSRMGGGVLWGQKHPLSNFYCEHARKLVKL